MEGASPNPDTTGEPGGRDPALRPSRAASSGPTLRRLHFYVGVFVAPFLVVAALTGLAYVFVPQMEQVAYQDQFYVEPGERPLPLAEQATAAREALPEGTITAVRPSEEADRTTEVELTIAAPGEPSAERTVYVDPYTAQVRGVLTTSWGSTPVAQWFSGLHKDLHLGDAGRLYSELAASWLWVLVLGGAVLWWRHRRGPRRLLRMLRPEPGAGPGLRRSRGRHAAAGVWLAAGLLALSATGLTWSTYAGARFDLIQDGLNAHSVLPDTSLEGAAATETHDVHEGHEHHGQPGDHAADLSAADTALAVARDHGLDGPVQIAPPPDAGHAWTVTQTDNRWPVREDAVAVDPTTAAVTDEARWRDQPPLAQLSALGIQAHMGTLFGPINQAVLSALALGLLAVIGWGYRMWWQRRPTRAGRRLLPGAPPARGAWRRLPPALLLLGVPAVIAVAWALPVLGVSLLAFLAVDALFGLLARRRARRP